MGNYNKMNKLLKLLPEGYNITTQTHHSSENYQETNR